MEKKGDILVFCSREICYLSGNFFANQIAAAFETLGYETKVCEFSAKYDDLDEKLQPFTGKQYELILDFNSLLPRLVMEDGEPYLDKLDGPFFDCILDHPLFHHNGLVNKVKNFRAIVLDEAHNAYVKQYYPNVKQVYTLPLGATEALYQGEKNKECRILFPGTYDRPEQVYQIIESAPEPLQGFMKRILEQRIAEPLLPMEEVFRQLLVEEELPVADAEFAMYMNGMYAVDAYVRDYFRKDVLDRLLKEKFPVTVMGEGWEKYACKDESTLRRERGVEFSLSFERIAKEHIILNVAPIFNRGMHDRIPAGMANHTVVLTDQNPYLEKELLHNETVSFYSLSKPDTILQSATQLMENQVLREQIEEKAYELYLEKYTWRAKAEQILRFAKETVTE